jgi:hypothetical protein
VVRLIHVALDAKPTGQSAGDVGYETGNLLAHGKLIGRRLHAKREDSRKRKATTHSERGDLRCLILGSWMALSFQPFGDHAGVGVDADEL